MTDPSMSEIARRLDETVAELRSVAKEVRDSHREFEAKFVTNMVHNLALDAARAEARANFETNARAIADLDKDSTEAIGKIETKMTKAEDFRRTAQLQLAGLFLAFLLSLLPWVLKITGGG